MSKLFEAALVKEGISGRLADFARSIHTQESSGGKNTKTSNHGATGGMQILPTTFKSVADKGWNIADPTHNARAGIRYAKAMWEKAKGDPALAGAGYYGGPGAITKAQRGVAVSDPKNPHAPNTLQYGQQVASRMAGPAQGQDPSKPIDLWVPTPQVAPPMAALPPATAAGAPTTGGAPITGGVPVPDQQVAASQPVPQAQGDAWTNFLQSMPQARQPVQVADMNWGAPIQPIDVRFTAPQAPAPRAVPNFQAFSSWQGRTA